MFMFYVISCHLSVSDSGGDSFIEDTHSSSVSSLSHEVIWRSAEQSYTTGMGMGDIDGDGDLDVVVSEGNDMEPGLVRVYYNIEGTLEEEASFFTAQPQYYGRLALGDLNGDGWVDLAVSKFLGSERFDSPGGVEVFMNRGGELSEYPDWSWDGAFSFSLSLGDINGDMLIDIVLAVGESYYNMPDRSRGFCNDGAEGFILCWEADADRYSFDVAVADINRDGAMDLLFAHEGEGHSIHLSDGTLPAITPSWQAQEGGFEGNTLDWGDINGDGVLDLVVSDNLQRDGIGRIRAWCGPEFGLCWQSEDDPQMQSALLLRDIDHDGDVDLLAGAWWGALRIYEQTEGGLSYEPSFIGQDDRIVAEEFAWGSIQATERITVSGTGIIEIDGRKTVISVENGVFCDGYIWGENFTAQLFASHEQQIFLSDWEPLSGNWGFSRVP